MAQDPTHNDIEQALTQAETGPDEATTNGEDLPSGDGTIVLDGPKTKNPIGQLWWGISSGTRKTLRATRKHPWKAALGLGASIACGQFLCVYSGVILLGFLMSTAIQSES